MKSDYVNYAISLIFSTFDFVKNLLGPGNSLLVTSF